MKIASWNVNSLKVRLHHVLDWLAAWQPEVLCLQETKTEDAAFPRAAIEAAGYQALFVGQKTYNGVALLSRRPGALVCTAIPGLADEQKRLIAADYDGLRVVSAYFPNGQEVASEKYAYKLRWMAALDGWLAGQLAQGRRLVLAGDFNVAPEDRDVHDPAAWAGHVLVSAAEREAFGSLIRHGMVDSFRLFDQPEKSYSWWDYRMLGFRRNHGLRIDHVLVSQSLQPYCRAAGIDREPRKLERPSDHTPVWLELDAAAISPDASARAHQ